VRRAAGGVDAWF